MNFPKPTGLEHLFQPHFSVVSGGKFTPEIKFKDDCDKLWDLVYKKLFSSYVNEDGISEQIKASRKEEIRKKREVFEHAFHSAKHKFQNEKRKIGGDYFNHQLEVAYDILDKSENPTFKDVIRALHHDSIEDTDITYSGLKDDFGDEVALGIQVISKKPFLDFALKSTSEGKELSEEEIEKIKELAILDEAGNTLSERYGKLRIKNSKKDTSKNWRFKQKKKYEELWLNSLTDVQKVQIIKLSGILNSKNLLSDEIKFKLKYHPDKITPEQEFALELYKSLEKKYKQVRDEEYFSHMLPRNGNIECAFYGFENYPCLSNFLNHVYNTHQEQNKGAFYEQKDDEFYKKTMFKSLELKFFDRLHNLRTSEIYTINTKCNISKANRKIFETEKYFYPIAKEFDKLMGTDFYSMLLFEVTRLKLFLSEIVSDGVKNDVGNLI